MAIGDEYEDGAIGGLSCHDEDDDDYDCYDDDNDDGPLIAVIMIMIMAAAILMILKLSVGTSWLTWDQRPRGGFLPSTAFIHR